MARLSPSSIIAGPILAGMTLLAPLGVAHAEMKIAVVNVPRLLDEAPQAKSAMQALQDEFAPRQKEIMSTQKELKAKAGEPLTLLPRDYESVAKARTSVARSLVLAGGIIAGAFLLARGAGDLVGGDSGGHPTKTN